MTTVSWSCGGGLQSTAIGVLIAEGRLPVPDLAVIVDTAREVSSTWDYLRDTLNPYLKAKRGFEVTIIPPTFKRVDLFAPDGTTITPAYTDAGRISAFCSGEWKRDAIERYLRSIGVKDCVQWLGFSTDERKRATGKAHRPWLRPAYPLIDLGISRWGCEEIVRKAGLPLPKKSRCWMCPHQNAEEWAEVLANPTEWAQAVAVDDAIRAMDPRDAGLYLHSSRVPLTLADLTVPEADEPLYRNCQEAGCFT